MPVVEVKFIGANYCGYDRSGDDKMRLLFLFLVVFLFPRVEGDDVVFFGPFLVLGGHGFDSVWVVGGEVYPFGAVVWDVVEFPGAFEAFCDEFPVAMADGAVAFVLEEDGFVSLDGLAFEGGGEGGSFYGSFRTWVGGLGEVEAGGHDVDEVGWLVHKGARMVSGEW